MLTNTTSRSEEKGGEKKKERKEKKKKKEEAISIEEGTITPYDQSHISQQMQEESIIFILFLFFCLRKRKTGKKNILYLD